MVIYFSGTGNSRYCARMIAQKLGDHAVDAARYIKEYIPAEFTAETPLVFVSPVYGWRMPKLFHDFIACCDIVAGNDAYFVLTCGSDIGNAGEQLKELCAQKRINYRGVLEVVMPENYIAMFPVPNEEKSEKIISKALPILEKGIGCIAERKPFPERRISLLDKAKSSFVNDIFCRYIIKSSPFRVDDRCIGCGKCADLCPLNNIELKDGKPVWDKDCTHCMACICHCPTEAIEYGRKSVGKRRYRCPEYK